MTVTIWGKVCAEGEPAAYYRSRGRHTWFAGAEAFDHLISELPDDGVHVTVGHGGERIGTMVYGEITDTGTVNAVAVLTDDTVTKLESDVYFSPEMVVIGRGVATRKVSIADAAALTGLALTTDPAGLGLRPIAWQRGDVRSSADRATWAGWRREPLLARCVDDLGTDWRRRRAIHLHRDPGIPPELGGGWVDYDGRPMIAAGRSLVAPGAGLRDRAAGTLWYRGGGRVLSVR